MLIHLLDVSVIRNITNDTIVPASTTRKIFVFRSIAARAGDISVMINVTQIFL